MLHQPFCLQYIINKKNKKIKFPSIIFVSFSNEKLEGFYFLFNYNFFVLFNRNLNNFSFSCINRKNYLRTNKFHLQPYNHINNILIFSFLLSDLFLYPRFGIICCNITLLRVISLPGQESKFKIQKNVSGIILSTLIIFYINYIF